MAEKKNKPAIRFEGFTDAWEQRKYANVINLLSGQDFPPSGYNDFGNGIPYMTGASCIDGKETIVNRWTLKPRCIVEKGDLLFVCKGSGYGTMAVLSQDKAHIARQFMALKNLPGFDKNFNFYLANSVVDSIKADARGLIAGIAREVILRQDINIPSIVEQQKIGIFFRNLDNLITLHQRKYEKTVNMKKAMLEKMFPRNDENVPQIRFKGFTDDWAQCKAVNIFQTVADKGYPNLPVLSASQEFGMIKRMETGINIYHDANNEVGYKRVLPGQFVIHLRSFQGGFAHSAVEGITSPAYIVLDFQEKERHCDCFWKYIFSSKAFVKRLKLITYGIRDGRSINFEEFINFDFLCPSYEEQKQIGQHFQEFDNLITLYQREIEKLQNIKKAFLERMFV